VYQVLNPAELLRREPVAEAEAGGRTRPRIRMRTVWLLGLCSLFTDISSEMVVAILPLYLVAVGGFSPLAFGIIDGLYNGATAILMLASGYIGDRWRRHKEVATAGYGISAICKLLLAVVGPALSSIGAIVLLDRAGKGIRTAPRDAMISLSVPREKLGVAFGLHRALDTTGAMLGPLVAFLILAVAPLAFGAIFVVSFFIALIGLGILVLLVQQRRAVPDAAEPAPAPSLRGAAGLLKVRRYRMVLIAGVVLSLATASDAFVFLALEDSVDLGSTLFPLLFVGSASTFMLLAIPMGRIADRYGRGRVLLGGYALLFCVYAALLLPIGGWPLVVLALALLGGYYAATDGVLMALGATVVPEELRGSGLALLRTATSVARMVASLTFGLLWTLGGIDLAIACFGAALVAATLLAAVVLHRTPEPAHG
jgi:MFS family permease